MLVGRTSPPSRASRVTRSSFSKDQTITARDGTKLAADVVPAREGARADRGQAPDAPHAARPTAGPRERATPRMVRRPRVRGGRQRLPRPVRSEGRWRMLLDDPNDGADVVKWIVAQPWSTGKVGTFGTSYVGGTQHALRLRQPAGAGVHDPGRLGVERRPRRHPPLRARSSCGSSTGRSSTAGRTPARRSPTPR